MGCINTVFRNLSYAMYYVYALYHLCLYLYVYVTQEARLCMYKRVCFCAPMSLDVCRQ